MDRMGAREFLIASACYFYQKVMEALKKTPTQGDQRITALLCQIMPVITPFVTPDSG
jgi:hypothetical protein